MDTRLGGITPVAYAARLRTRIPRLRLHLLEIPIVSYQGYVPNGRAHSVLTNVFLEGQHFVLRRDGIAVARSLTLSLLVDLDAHDWERRG